MKRLRRQLKVRPSVTAPIFASRSRWHRWMLAIGLVVIVAGAYIPEVAFWLGHLEHRPQNVIAILRKLTLPYEVRRWYSTLVQPMLVRDGIIFSILCFYLLIHIRKPPLTWRFISSMAILCYLGGCAISLSLFYLKFGYFRIAQNSSGETLWELIAYPYHHVVSWLQGRAPAVVSGRYQPLNQSNMEIIWRCYVRTPFAVIIAFSVIAIAIVWSKQKQAQRYCKHCGYDLIGSTASTHCPECGAAISLRLVVNNTSSSTLLRKDYV